MLQYKYTHTGTEATTGYFSAEPWPAMEPAEALRYLAAHPLDDFMRRHIIRRMASLSAGEIQAIASDAFPKGPLPVAVASLLEELALLFPDSSHSPVAIPPDKDGDAASSLIFLRWGNLPDREQHRLWGEFFNANIQQHRALKSPAETGLSPLYPDSAPENENLPGLGPVFVQDFPLTLQDIFPRYRAAATGPAYERPPAAETAALAEERLARLGLIAGQEMRHTASLSPVALLRPWRIQLTVNQARHAYTLEGQATTYGRGLSLADARASCLMEMVERASAYLSVDDAGILERATPLPVMRARRSRILERHGPAVDPNDYPLETPYNDEALVWTRGTTADGTTVHVPVQMAGLFCNLDDIALYDSPGSTGIATGCTMAEAKLAALLEVFERDAEATTPFHKSTCFRLEADEKDDPLIAALLADYAARGINVQFQTLIGPMGVPVYKCFVMSPKGAIARGHGSGLSAKKAVISAMTETPFPYPDGGPSGPMLRKLPVVNLRDLPDYVLPRPEQNLAMLEELLTANGRPPVYVDLTYENLKFPVVRVLIPGLEVAADRDSFSRVPWRLWKNYRYFLNS